MQLVFVGTRHAVSGIRGMQSVGNMTKLNLSVCLKREKQFIKKSRRMKAPNPFPEETFA
jgi:hypothetical protein